MPKSVDADAGHDPKSHKISPQDPVFAALDLGTNNCRLLIAKTVPNASKANNGLRVLDSFSRIVRLGEGISASGMLCGEAMDRTIMALRVCKKKLEKYDVSHARFVATEACRQASNSKEFLHKVKHELGLDIKIISTEEEAKLAFMGCATLLEDSFPHALVFDIGGGSTEFMWITKNDESPPVPRIKDWFSLNQGVMNLSEKFGGHQFADMVFDEMVEKLCAKLEDFDGNNDISSAVESGTVQLLSTSGTVTTLAAIHMGLQRYERSRIDGITLPTEALRKAVRTILKMRPSERFSHPCIGSDRSDYIISGCAIFEAICTLWDIPSITIADRGVREGIIISLIKKHVK
jgi:exopolyphosphatase/guanosine-5'-triphosphate,3'-diphosphate pyrophosphatase